MAGQAPSQGIYGGWVKGEETASGGMDEAASLRRGQGRGAAAAPGLPRQEEGGPILGGGNNRASGSGRRSLLGLASARHDLRQIALRLGSSRDLTYGAPSGMCGPSSRRALSLRLRLSCLAPFGLPVPGLSSCVLCVPRRVSGCFRRGVGPRRLDVLGDC